MNVLIVSTYDLKGGAAIAAYRLLLALNKNGVNSRMLTINKQSDNKNVTEVGNKFINNYHFAAERGIIFIKNNFSRNNLFDISIGNTGCSITNHPAFKEAEIIHLHWINQGMLSVRELGRILASGKKIVWTMHDMWSFTGICHHAQKCTQYEYGCSNCHYLNKPSKYDISHSVYLQKQAVYSQGAVHFVACSNWLRELALKSPLTEDHNVSAIANPIDIEQYYPKDKKLVRKALNLPIDKKIILFAAAKVSDKRKGIDYLIEASKILAKQKEENCMFLVAGENSQEIISQLALPAVSAGYVPSSEMASLYNASDLFVTPSLQENLPNTIMESMACGTPCVGFNIGGIPEMIEHKKNGYIANYKDSKDLANGLLWVLNEAPETVKENARKKVVDNYSEDIIAKRYIEVYKKGC